MLKIHYILLAAAFILITGLSFLPKTVVKNLDKELSENTDSKSNTSKDKNKLADSTETPHSDNPNDITAMHNAEMTQEQKNKLAKFSKSFETANENTKVKGQWLDSMIVLLQSANRYDTAALLAGNFAETNNTTANLMRAGDTYYSSLQFSMNEEKTKEFAEKARKYFQKVVDKEPDFSEAKVKLGLTYVASPTPMQGILLIREVLKSEPENTFAIMSLGKLSIQSGQYDKAVERFRQVLDLQKDNIEAKFLLAVSLGESGKKTEAISLLEELKKTTTDPAVLMQTETYLKQLK
jgi:tetratricopeptide (TPR) repeat protein